MLSLKKTTFQTYNKKSPVQISRFLHNKKITCANLAVFAQQIHFINIDNFYLLMYHRYRLNRGVLHKADRKYLGTLYQGIFLLHRK